MLSNQNLEEMQALASAPNSDNDEEEQTNQQNIINIDDDDEDQNKMNNDSDEEEDEDQDNDPSNQITITIKKLDSETFVLHCSKTATVSSLKSQIDEEQSVASHLQRLIYRAQELQDDFPLAQYGVQNNSTLHLVIRRNVNSNGGDAANVPNNGVVDPYLAHGFGQMAPADMIDVMSVVRLCRFVRIFALIDAVFLLIYGLQAFYFIILAILAVAGYWGAKNLDRKYLIMYFICLGLEVAVRGFFIYLSPTNVVNVILLALMILIDFFVLRCVFKLYRAIPLLSADQRDRILILNRVGLI